MILNESIFDDVIEIEVPDVAVEVEADDLNPSGPAPGADTGITDLLLSLINDENATIQAYNSFKASLEGHEDFVPVIDDISSEEYNHVGMLQSLLKKVSPNSELIDQGISEAEEQLCDDDPIGCCDMFESFMDSRPLSIHIQKPLHESAEGIYFKAYVTNLGKYNEGELVGQWVDFPIDEDEFEKVLESIGIGDSDDFGAPYEEWFVTDYDCNLPAFDWQQLGEYPGYEALQEFGEKLEGVDDVEAVSNAMEVTNDLDEAIEGLSSGNIMFYPGISNEEDLARMVIDEWYGGVEQLDPSTLESYFDYEMLGRDLGFDTYENPNDPDGDDISAGEYWCGDENASDQEIGEAFVEDVGFDGVQNPEYYFDYEAYGRDLSYDGFTFTSDGCIEYR